MQRVHISPRLGDKPVDRVTIARRRDRRRARCSTPGSRRRPCATSSRSCTRSSSTRSTAAGRRRTPSGARAARSAAAPATPNPDLQFLTVAELEAVLRAIPDEVVRAPRADAPRPRRQRAAGPARRPRAGDPRRDPHGRDDRPAPVRAARPALARRRLDRAAHPRPQRLGARRALGRGQVRPLDAPLGADGRPARARAATAGRSARCTAPTTTWSSPTRSRAGRSTARSSRAASSRRALDAGVRPVRFHDLRHTFATRLAASGQPMRTIQEFLGHADSKTTQIYAHYAPQRARGRDGQRRVRLAWGPRRGTRRGTN